MLIYIIIYLIIFVFTLFRISDKGKKYILFYVSIGLVLFAGLREDTAGDYLVYESIFYKVKNSVIKEDLGVEISYYYISKISIFFNTGFNGVLLIYAGLTLLCLSSAITIIAPKLSLYVVLYYYSYYYFLQGFIQIRAGLAAAILMLAICLIIKKQQRYYYGLIIVGSFFHSSIFLALPFYALCQKFDLTFKKGLIIFIIVLIVGKYIKIMPFFFSLLPQSEGLIVSKLISHEAVSEAGVASRTASVYFIITILKSMFCLFMLYYKENIKIFFPTINTFLIIYFIANCSYILLGDVHIIAARVSEFAGIVELIVAPCIMYTKFPFKKIIFYLISVVQLMAVLYFIGGNFIQPYKLAF
jgi:hypothetical protein